MASIEALETKLKRLMVGAVQRWDNRELSRLNALAELLSRARTARDSVEKNLERGVDTGQASPKRTSGAERATDDARLISRDKPIVVVTEGDKRQRLFRLAKLRRLGFDLPLGKEISIEALTPAGTMRFRTSVAEPPRLRARREVAAFYRAAKVRAGDCVLFESIGTDSYRISKVPRELQDSEQVEFLSGLEKNLSEWNSPSDDEAYGDL